MKYELCLPIQNTRVEVKGIWTLLTVQPTSGRHSLHHEHQCGKWSYITCVCVCVHVHKYTHTSGSVYGASPYWCTKWQEDRGTMSGHYCDPCSLPCTIIPHLSTSLYLLFNLINFLHYLTFLCQSSFRSMKVEFIAWPHLNLTYWKYLAEPYLSSTSQST